MLSCSLVLVLVFRAEGTTQQRHDKRATSIASSFLFTSFSASPLLIITLSLYNHVFKGLSPTKCIVFCTFLCTASLSRPSIFPSPPDHLHWLGCPQSPPTRMVQYMYTCCCHALETVSHSLVNERVFWLHIIVSFLSNRQSPSCV